MILLAPHTEGLRKPGESTAISVHLYGPRMGEVYGRDYNPSRDRICDRRED